MAGIIVMGESVSTEDSAVMSTGTSTEEITNSDSGDTQSEIQENNTKSTSTAETSTDSSSSTESSSSLSKSESSSTPKKSFLKTLPKFDTTDWYKHKCFNRYWSHHEHVTNWYKKHCQVYKSLHKNRNFRQNVQNNHNYSLYPYPHMYNRMDNSNAYQTSTSAKETRKAKKRPVKNVNIMSERSAAVKRKQADLNMDVEVEDGRSEENGAMSSDVPELVPIEQSAPGEMEMDISEEMLDFFAKTQRHRREREAEKKAEKEKQKQEKRINIEEASGLQKERTSEAPKEQPGSRRTAEMKMIYGKGAALIHGMETALQMTYDRNFDVNQPRYWPNMPFRIVFADS